MSNCGARVFNRNRTVLGHTTNMRVCTEEFNQTQKVRNVESRQILQQNTNFIPELYNKHVNLQFNSSTPAVLPVYQSYAKRFQKTFIFSFFFFFF